MVVKRASAIHPLTPASLALIIVGSLLVISLSVVGFIYWRKRHGALRPGPSKPDDRSSSTGSEEHQLENVVGNPTSGQRSELAENPRHSVGIMSRMSYGGAPRSPRPARSPGTKNRYSVGMLSRTSVDPAVSSLSADRNRSRSRTREEKDRAYARLSMGVMSRASMGTRSPGPRSPMSPRDPLMSAGIMSRMPASPMPRNLSAAPSPAIREGGFLEPPPQYS